MRKRGRKPQEYSVLRDPFLQAMARELHVAEQMHAPFNSVHEVYAVILEEVDALWDEVRKKKGVCAPERIREELVQIAAMAWRAARDLGMDEERLTVDLDPEVLFEQQKAATDGIAEWDRLIDPHMLYGD